MSEESQPQTITIPKPTFVAGAEGYIKLGSIPVATTCRAVDLAGLTAGTAAIVARALNADAEAARDILSLLTAAPAPARMSTATAAFLSVSPIDLINGLIDQFKVRPDEGAKKGGEKDRPLSSGLEAALNAVSEAAEAPGDEPPLEEGQPQAA